MTFLVFTFVAFIKLKNMKTKTAATEPKQMFLTVVYPDTVSIKIAGIGNMTIDWGDGTPVASYMLHNFDAEGWQYDWAEYEYHHTYRTFATRIIIITGEKITHLKCVKFYLESLDVSRNTELNELDCSYNRLISAPVELLSLDISKNTALTKLVCVSSNLKSLNVSNNTALEVLDCRDNKLKNLDISKNTALTHLVCYYNKLKDLDLSNNTQLKILHCGGNQLTILDLENNLALQQINCWQNHLTVLKLAKNVELKELDCSNNEFSSDTLYNFLIMSPVVQGLRFENNPGTTDCNKKFIENNRCKLPEKIKLTIRERPHDYFGLHIAGS